MKYETATCLIAFFGLAAAAPMPVPEPKNVWTYSIPRAMLRGREVPQEHSHDRFLDGVRVNLNLNNPNKIGDPVFGLLGSAAAAAGAGSITNIDCLHQATADQAFTNAKAAKNVTGQADALMYAALERNTAGVGVKSVICTEKPVNAEIAAVQQHQDPASTGAAAANKAVVLALAKQLQSIGADPQEALLSGTFPPGTIGDPTEKGKTCDTLNDPDGGCIFSQKLLVDDATAAEITAAVKGIASRAALDFGTCSDPAILFENGLDGRTQPAFIAANQADFPHGSALNIGVISGFICQRLGSSCAASAATVTACTSAEAAASAAGGTTQAAADAFNSALGVSASGSKAASPAAPAASPAAAAAPAASPAAAAASTASSSNVQTFTGSLGGLPPPVSETAGSDRPFTVEGDTFVNEAAALQRSCSVQANACANAVNSGALSGETVGDCNTQEASCNAAAK